MAFNEINLTDHISEIDNHVDFINLVEKSTSNKKIRTGSVRSSNRQRIKPSIAVTMAGNSRLE